MTERDQKVLAIVVAFVVLGGFWFLVVHKKQAAIKEAQVVQTAAQADLDAAKIAETQALSVAKVKPAAYSRLLRLGKAIPTDKDFESLLVQVNDITDDSKVNFVSLSATEGTVEASAGATGTTTCDATASTAGASGSTGAAPATGATGASGSTAETWVGKDRDKAKGAVEASDGANSSTEAAANAVTCADAPSLTDIAATAAGLESEQYSFSFTGSFYNLKDVYNGLLDMVKVNNGRVKVTGRLLDINSITMNVSAFPNLSASVAMTGYKLPVSASSAGATAAAPGDASLAANATQQANTASANASTAP